MVAAFAATAALADPQLRNKRIFFYSGTHPHRRTNAACLICCWAIIYLNQTPDEAYAPFRGVHPPFAPFHDATPITCTYNLSVYDCLCGLYKAKNLQFFEFDTFDPDEYEYYEEEGEEDGNEAAPDVPPLPPLSPARSLSLPVGGGGAAPSGGGASRCWRTTSSFSPCSPAKLA